MSRGSRCSFPHHLRSHFSVEIAACGNIGGPHLQKRSLARVECKNCLAIIAANKETRYFKPLAQPAPPPPESPEQAHVNGEKLS